MQAAEYVQMAEVQHCHWWFEAKRKRRTVDALLTRHAVGDRVLSSTGRVLEVGSGTGLTKRVLQGSPALGGGGEAGGVNGTAAGGYDVPAHSDLAPVAPWLNAALLSIYRLETPLTARFRMPFGVSLLILARRSPA